MKKYKYLFIDLDNTVLDFDLAQDKSLDRLLLQNGIKQQQLQEIKTFYIKLNHQMWLDLEQGKITKKQLIDSRFQILFKHFNIDLDGIKLAKQFEDILGDYGDEIVGASQFLNNLKQAGYKLYALTNGITNIQKRRLNNSNISQYFDDVFISQEFNSSKPHARFYELVSLKIEGFNKEKTLMIGDSLSADIQGAINFGIDSIWYNPNSLNNNNLATYTAKNFKEIEEILIKE